MPDYTPPLLKTVEPWTDEDGLVWLPVAGWGQDTQEIGAGFPWQLETTLRLAVPDNDWDYLAFTGHFVTGLRDEYEHTFDSWERQGGEYKEFNEQMLPVDWVIREAAEALGVGDEVAQHLLLYRTLQTRVPEGLLKWYAWKSGEVAEARLAHADIFKANWEVHRLQAGDDLQHGYSGDLSWPATPVPMFDVKPNLTLRVLVGDGPARSPMMSRLLDYLLTDSLVRWQDLYESTAGHTLAFKAQSLALLRRRTEESDPSGRIGTLEGGRCSDEALLLLLRARLMNAVAPVGLWTELGLDALPGAWRLPLATLDAPGRHRAEED